MKAQTIGLLTVLLAMSGLGTAHAQALPPTLDACTRIPTDSARLQCFDRAAAALSHPDGAAQHRSPAIADTPAPAAAPAAAAAPAVPQLTPEQKFGLTANQVARQEEARGAAAVQPSVTRVQTQVVQVSGTSSGRALITLENGQTWRQTETRSAFSLSPGDRVTVSRGAMGTFWISTGPHNSTRVERVH